MNLISLLISVSLSFIIITGAFEVYNLIRKTELHQKQAFYELDLLHISLQFFVKDLQSSGYRGCRSLDPSFPIRRHYSSSNAEYRFFRWDRAVFGFAASTGNCIGKLSTELCQKIKENSEVLMIYNVAQKITSINTMLRAGDKIIAKEKPQIWLNSLVLISDCMQGDLFIATKVEDNEIHHEDRLQINNSHLLSKAYGLDAEVTELQTVVYYLAPSISQSENKNKPVIYGLFRKDMLHPAVEIMQSVIDLKFEYGILSEDNKQMIYKKSEALAEKEFTSVRSVRITIISETNQEWTYEVALRNYYGKQHL